MSDLSPEAKALLRRARTAFSPPQGRLDAVRAALPHRVASPADANVDSLSSSAVSSSTRDRGSAPRSGVVVRAAQRSAAIYKIGAALVLAAAGGVGLARWSTPPTARTATEVGELRASSIESPVPILTALPLPAHTAETSPHETQPDRSANRASSDRTRSAHAKSKRTMAEPTSARESMADPIASAPGSDLAGAPDKVASTPAITAAPASPSTLIDDSLAEEITLLRGARSALDRGEAATAMTLLDSHETKFERGTLFEERLATRVLALCALHRADAARTAAQELERAAPRSPHLARVRSSCVGAPKK